MSDKKTINPISEDEQDDFLKQAAKFGHERRVAEMARDLYIASLGDLRKEYCIEKAEEYYKE